MNKLQNVISEVILQPIKRQERIDELIQLTFDLNIKHESKLEVAAYFKLIGPNIIKLSRETRAVTSRLMYYLEIDADPRAPHQTVMRDINDSGHLLADRDIEWNADLVRNLIRVLRDCVMAVGIYNPEQNPAQMMQQAQAINAYLQAEKLEIQKEIANPSIDRELKTRLIEDR